MGRLELFDLEGNRFPGMKEREEGPPEGLYFRAIHLILRDREGRFLLQLRSPAKRNREMDLFVTSGAVEPGESPRNAAVREAFEEMGLVLAPEDLTLIGCLPIGYWLVSIFDGRCTVELEDLVPDPAEVTSIYRMGFDSMVNSLSENSFITREYISCLYEYYTQEG